MHKNERNTAGTLISSRGCTRLSRNSQQLDIFSAETCKKRCIKQRPKSDVVFLLHMANAAEIISHETSIILLLHLEKTLKFFSHGF